MSLEARKSALEVQRMILRKFAPELQQEFVAVSEKNGKALSEAIARQAPVSEDEDPGQLKRSVKYELDGMKVTVTAGGGDASHATYVEFGTRAMRAEPFFFTTYRLLKKRLWGGYGRALSRVAKKYSA